MVPSLQRLLVTVWIHAYGKMKEVLWKISRLSHQSINFIYHPLIRMRNFHVCEEPAIK